MPVIKLLRRFVRRAPADPHGYGMPVFSTMRWAPKPGEKIRSHP